MKAKAQRGQPPVETRFVKGTSGNPNGRPRKAVPVRPSAFDIVIAKTLTVTRNGVERQVTVDEALQHKTYQDAIAGNRPARRQVLKWIAKREQAIASRYKPSYRVLPTLIEIDPDNADPAMLILGIVCRDSARQDPKFEREQLLLEPWAVQMALSRRRGGAALEEKQISEIRRCTRNPETLRWPRGTRS